MAPIHDSAPQLTVRTELDPSGTPLVRVAGELDLATAGQLTKAASVALEGKPGQIVFDLSELRFMDSSGLRVFLEIANEAKVCVRAASDAVRRVIESTGVDSVIDLEPS